MRYEAIRKHRRQYPVRMMCRLLDVSSSGYYAWQGRRPNRWTQRRSVLLRKILRIHHEHRRVYGSPRIHKTLLARGERCCVHTVAKIMRENGIQSRIKHRFRVAKGAPPRTWIAPNVLNRQFCPPVKDHVWASDLTQISTTEGWLYLAVVMDLYSRRIIGWAMGSRMSDRLTIRALESAVDCRQPKTGILHHSDQGTQYSSHAYQATVKRHGMTVSMSRQGDCYDNAVVESFFHTLKTEHIPFQKYKTRAEARRDLFEWIEVYYNRRRIHSTLGYVSPSEYEDAA